MVLAVFSQLHFVPHWSDHNIDNLDCQILSESIIQWSHSAIVDNQLDHTGSSDWRCSTACPCTLPAASQLSAEVVQKS